MKLLASIAVAALLPLLAPGAGWCTTVVVTPGPGTPLQDAIDAAAPGTKLLLQEGTFAEAITIDKRLTLTLATRAQVIIDASSNNAAFAVDITADDVMLKGWRADNGSQLLNVRGGQTAAIHVGARTGIRLRALFGPDNGAVPPPTGMVLDGTLDISVKKSSFTGTTAGGRLSGIPLGASVRIQDSRFNSPLTGSGDGLVIQDSAMARHS